MSFESKKILIVEDEKGLRLPLAAVLRNEGFNVMEATDGEQGLQKALETHPDLMIVDIVMPVLDGISMLKKLREDPWGKNAEALLLTNLPYDKKAQEGFEQGVFEYLVKSDWSITAIAGKVKEKFKSVHS